MILKKGTSVYKMKKVYVSQTPDILGCDKCKKQLTNSPPLEVVVFYNDEKLMKKESTDGLQSERYIFCSWKCVAKFIPTIKTDYFVNLPYIMYDNKSEKGMRVDDFLKILK